MFDCPALESELLAGVQAVASRPLAELLLQNGILRTGQPPKLLEFLKLAKKS